jgi:hypothetical protein
VKSSTVLVVCAWLFSALVGVVVWRALDDGVEERSRSAEAEAVPEVPPSPSAPSRAAHETTDVFLWRVLTVGDGMLPAGYRGYLGQLVDENVCRVTAQALNETGLATNAMMHGSGVVYYCAREREIRQ